MLLKILLNFIQLECVKVFKGLRGRGCPMLFPNLWANNHLPERRAQKKIYSLGFAKVFAQLSCATIDSRRIFFGTGKDFYFLIYVLVFTNILLIKVKYRRFKVRQPSCSVDLKPVIHASCQAVVGIQLSFSSSHLSQCSSLVTTLIINPLAFLVENASFTKKRKA